MHYSSSAGNPIVYWSIYVLLTILLAFCGWKIANDNSKQTHFKKYAWIAGVSYSLIEGLRWMRGADYYHYYMDLSTNFAIGAYCTQNPELLYKLWVNLFHFLGVDPTIVFILYSALLICGILLIFKKYPKAAAWGLPLFFLMTNGQTENIIRQTFATSFLILAYVCYLYNRQKLMLVMLCIVPFIHMSGLYGVVLFLFFVYCKKPIKSPWLLLVLYAFTFFCWKPEWFQSFADYISQFNLGEDNNMQNYIDNSDRFFTEEGSMANVLGKKRYQLSTIYLTISFIVNCITIFIGFKLSKNDFKLQVMYYFAYIALILKSIAGDIELFIRFANWTDMMMPLLVAVSLTRLDLLKNPHLKIPIYILFAINYAFYGFVRVIGSIPYAGCAFVWDK